MNNLNKHLALSSTLRLWNTVALLALMGIFSIFPNHLQAATVAYNPSQENILNPERGLYLHPGNCNSDTLWSADTLKAKLDEKQMRLVLCIFYIDKNNTSPTVPLQISQQDINTLTHNLNAVKIAKAKAILRFAYFSCDEEKLRINPSDCDAKRPNDPPVATILAHIQDLHKVLKDHTSTVAVMEAGFIGKWGEWNSSSIPDSDLAGRSEIVRRLQTIFPSHMVQVRTPVIKKNLTNVAINRVGYHVDCFLSTPKDGGTFVDQSVDPANRTVEQQRADMANETLRVAMGGEVCIFADREFPQRALCPNAAQEFGILHFSYLNGTGPKNVIDGWEGGGCMQTIRKQLGYRLALSSSTFPYAALVGGTLKATIKLTNEGWAAPVNPRPVDLILRERSAPNRIVKFRLTTDPRQWKPTMLDEFITINVAVNIGTTPVGTYDLFLSLPDGSGLGSIPEYAIRFASKDINNNDVWNGTTGHNSLAQQLVIRLQHPDPIVTDSPISTDPQKATMN